MDEVRIEEDADRGQNTEEGLEDQHNQEYYNDSLQLHTQGYDHEYNETHQMKTESQADENLGIAQVNKIGNFNSGNVKRQKTIEKVDREAIVTTTEGEDPIRINETFLSRSNHNFEKLMELKMQITNDLGGKNLNFKLRNDEGGNNTFNNSIEKDFDIPGKINSLFTELNEMEAKAKEKASSSLFQKKNDTDHKISTKNISEFKLSMMVRNKLGEEPRKHPDPNQIIHNHGNLIRIIKSPNSLISEKTKNCMDRLLCNGFVEANQFQLVSKPNNSTVTSNRKEVKNEKSNHKDDAKFARKNSPMKPIRSGNGISESATIATKNQSVIDQKKSEILNILNNKTKVEKSSSNGALGNATTTNQKKYSSSFRYKDSEDFIKKVGISNDNDNIMQKIKLMIPDISGTVNSNKETRRGYDVKSPISSTKVKRLDDQISRMFKGY